MRKEKRAIGRRTSGVIFHFAPPAMQTALQDPQLLLSDVARRRVHGEVGRQPGLGEGLVDGYPLLLCGRRGSGRCRRWARALQGRQQVLLRRAAAGAAQDQRNQTEIKACLCRGRQLTAFSNKTHHGRGGGCPVVPPGGAEESMSSTGEVHTGLLEANSIAYWSTSARGNLFGPEP